MRGGSEADEEYLEWKRRRATPSAVVMQWWDFVRMPMRIGLAPLFRQGGGRLRSERPRLRSLLSGVLPNPRFKGGDLLVVACAGLPVGPLGKCGAVQTIYPLAFHGQWARRKIFLMLS